MFNVSILLNFASMLGVQVFRLFLKYSIINNDMIVSPVALSAFLFGRQYTYFSFVTTGGSHYGIYTVQQTDATNTILLPPP